MKKLLLLLAFVGAFTTGKSQILNTIYCQTNNQVYCVAVDSVNNIVYLGGNFSQVCGSPRSKIAAMNLTTGALLPWNPTMNGDVYSMYVHNNALYVGGFFTTVNGQPHNRIAKFYSPSGTLTTWNPGITTGNYVSCITGRGNKIYFGGDVLITVGTGKYVAEVDTAAGTPTPWVDYPNNQVNALAIDGNHLYVGGIFTQVGSTPQNYIAKYYLSSGATLSAWNPILDGNVQALCAKSGTLYVGGAFTLVDIDSREKLAEIDTSSGAATSWDPSVDNDVTDIEYNKGVVYILGNFSMIGGTTPRNFVAAISSSSGLATGWEAQVNATTMDATIAGGQIFLGGGFNSVLGQTRNAFAAICINPIDNISANINGESIVCAGLPSSTYSISPVTGATSYVWSYSGTGVTINGSGNSVNLDFSLAPAQGGNLTVYATNGCQTTNTVTIPVNTYNFQANISGNTSFVCGDSTQLFASDSYMGNGTLSYTWSPSTALSYTNIPSTTSGTQSSITYTYNVVSSEGCVATTTVDITVAPISIPLTTAFGGTILCSTADTIIATNDYTGFGTVTYTWAPTTGLNLSDPSKPVASPVVSTGYTVTASASDGCASNPSSIYITVTPLTLNMQASPSIITCGNTSTLSATNDYPGTGTITYTWSPAADLSNANIVNPVASPTISTNYQLDISTPEGCLASNSVFVQVDALQITANAALNTNCGTPVNLTSSNNSGNPNLVFLWSPSSSLSLPNAPATSANPSSTTIYTVTVSLPGCTSASTMDTVNILPPSTPNICEVTTDSASQYNIIYWDKAMYQPTDSFIIYRETTTNTYSQIGVVAHTALSEFTDTTRSVGPANGDPNIGTYRYKIAVKDSCGYISAKSPYHNSVYFIDLQTGTFTWNLYAVENATTPVTQFNLLRDDLNNGVWAVIGTVTGTQTTLNDPNYSTHQNLANWRVEALGFNCASTARQADGTMAAVVKSKSNITNNRQIGIKNIVDANIRIYPNPNNGNFVIALGGLQGNTTVKIYSVLGEEIFSSIGNEKLFVDLGNFENGTYILQLSNNASIITKRIIKN